MCCHVLFQHFVLLMNQSQLSPIAAANVATTMSTLIVNNLLLYCAKPVSRLN